MAEHTQLSILERKLKKIRIYRKISPFLAAMLSFAVFVTIMSYGYIHPFYFSIYGFVLIIIVIASSNILKRYYDKKEAQVLEQIHKLKLWKGYGEN